MAGSLRVPLAVLRSRLALALPALFTLGWLIYVEGSDQWERVAAVWPTSTTMIFGSFVAGSTPQGGGAEQYQQGTQPLSASIHNVMPDVFHHIHVGMQLLNDEPVDLLEFSGDNCAYLVHKAVVQ